MRHYIMFDTPLGSVWVAENQKKLTHAGFGQPLPLQDAVQESTPLLSKARTQILDYFASKRRQFELPMEPPGSEFQLQVWHALRRIPYGETRSYTEIAHLIGRPNSIRAVGLAVSKNPLLLVIPCHRVVGADGDLVSYEAGLDIKRALLAREGVEHAPL